MEMRSVLAAATKVAKVRSGTSRQFCRCLVDNAKMDDDRDSGSKNKPSDTDTPVTTFTTVKVVTPGKARLRSHAPEPPDPLTCCGSGCADCVWIEYGTKLMHYYSDRPLQDALDKIDKQVENIGLREFIKTEIRLRAKYRSK